MSGICGWIGGSDATRADINRMAGALPRAEGQDISGATAGGAAVGAVFWPGTGSIHCQESVLAAIEGAPRWTDSALRERAAKEGPAAALSEGWRKYGRGVLDRVQGAFALGLIEPGSGRGLLAVDRFGICSMKFVLLPGGGLAFGSSVDAILTHPQVEARLSPQALLFYLCFFVIPAPLTIWRGMQKLMAGQCVALEPGRDVRAVHYWRTPYGSEDVADVAALKLELNERLHEAVARVVEGRKNGEIGAFLSGGLDSSSVCGVLARLFDEPVKAFTIGFSEERYDETPFARLAAEKFKLDHRVIQLQESDAVGCIQKLAIAYDEPFANSSAIPAYFCAKQAHDSGVRIMVAGDGGDEIFGGNERYLPRRRDELYRNLPRHLRKHLITPLIRGMSLLGGAEFSKRVRARVNYVETPMPDRVLADNWFAIRGADSVFSNDLLEDLDAEAPFSWLREIYEAAESRDPVQRHMHLDMQITLADNDLRKVTRMCELAGCQVRFPMLDEDLVDFAASIPGKVLLGGGDLRGFYKSAVADFLPNGIVRKKKHGFGMPFGEWMKRNPELHELARESLSALGRRGLLRSEFLEEVASGWETGTAFASGGEVWDLTLLELWLRRAEETAQKGS